MLRVRIAIAGGVLAVFVAFLGMWAITPALALESALNAPDEATVPSVPKLDSISMDDQRFPLVRNGGLIMKRFPEGVPVMAQGGRAQTPPEVEQLVVAAADAAGVGGLASQLLNTSDTDSPIYEGRVTYPYRYPQLDSATAGISAAVIRQHRDDLVELSSALLYAARPPAAFSLLKRMQQVENSCQVQANLAAAVALGFKPPQDAVEAEFTAAKRLCPDQPVVHAAYAKVRLGFDTRLWQPAAGDNAGFHIGHIGEEARALAAAREVERQFPTHPIGYATEATILLEVADKYGQAGRHPFSVRAMYERALVLLDAVGVALPDDPTVTFGRARALAGLGRPKEAAALATSVAPTFRDRDARYARDSLRSMYLDLGRPSDAVDLMTPPGSTDPFGSEVSTAGYMKDASCLSLLPFGDSSFRGTAGDPEPGWRGNCYVAFVDATGNQYPGGADVLDFMDYIPLYRHEAPYREDLLVVADQDDVEQEAGGTDAFLAAKGRWDEVRPTAVDSVLESLQDAYRRAGMRAKAEEFLRGALDSGRGDPSHAADRLGEVLYLQGNYREAAEQFARAAEASPSTGERGWTNGSYAAAAIGSEWSTVKRAAALYRLEDASAAERLLAGLRTADAQVGDVDPKWDHAALEVSRLSLLGTIRLKGQAYDAAVPPLREAVTACEPWRSTDIDPCASGVQFNNLAVALLRSGKPEEAASFAKRAIAQDPHNSMFVEALANALEEAGQVGPAIDIYQQAIALDPTQATAHNNLGVLLAQSGRADEAQQHFIAATRAQPDYAGAWFNLGLSFATAGDPIGFLRSQGALARAAQHSPAFRGADREWYSDRQVYDPGLDLSKPLPKDWSAGAQRQPVPLGLAAVLVAVVTLAVGHVLNDKLQSALINASLAERAGRVSLRESAVGDLVAGVLCTAAVGFAAVAALGAGFWPIVTGLTLGLLVASAFLALRRTGTPTAQHGLSLPGTAVAGAGAVFGVPFVPVPILGTDVRANARWTPYLALGGMATVAAGLTWATGVPVLRTTFDLLVVTLASGLIAIAPLDGTRLGGRVSRVVAVLLAVSALALALRWV